MVQESNTSHKNMQPFNSLFSEPDLILAQDHKMGTQWE